MVQEDSSRRFLDRRQSGSQGRSGSCGEENNPMTPWSSSTHCVECATQPHMFLEDKYNGLQHRLVSSAATSPEEDVTTVAP